LQTLVSPHPYTYLIWGPIFVFNGVFCISQFVDPFKTISQKCVRAWYIVSCILQVGWMISFSFEIMWASCVMAFLLMLVVLRIRRNMYVYDKYPSFFQYWLCYFPFSFHGGLIVASLGVNLNIWLVNLDDMYFQIIFTTSHSFVCLGFFS